MTLGENMPSMGMVWEAMPSLSPSRMMSLLTKVTLAATTITESRLTSHGTSSRQRHASFIKATSSGYRNAVSMWRLLIMLETDLSIPQKSGVTASTGSECT